MRGLFWLALGAFKGIFRAIIEVSRLVRVARPW